ncbi:class II aldolase/adducin family protein [Crenalkalicoccus roseus]|uniref:class II aldolase/adducin family protein n=1 Tax=Crenalkalicoccus roseus TaxID=1485588 RepID=UPI0010820EF0|nr:class II aldolase/adducin family protein [Crenalkalicoccus roseus]
MPSIHGAARGRTPRRSGGEAAREALLAAARALDAAGFMPGRSGNLSLRTARGFLITPSGLPYADTAPADLVELAPDGAVLSGHRRPSSEWRLHAAIYAARPEAGAVVHTHSPFATALSCARQGIPPLHYMIALAGGEDIRCSAYATFGTAALAEAAVAALAGRRAALLANHGVVALGATLAGAEALAFEVENLARQYLALRAAGLAPVLLGATEIAEALARFEDYARPG